ncbi:Sir2 family NAD-dependent protein deacetylase [Saccharopolyspora sp. HNM0983]|uniref:protein acetyllysine N-acetyltransferase n=1 Tax=Saccharopolyspora montiporae TaxID=2781240 RepID=A0A929B8Y9_9PSEU|nr:Sir2 family NAD-dependent protein deacetylase [Saccharopolyspora sp. HNM0983]MBE9373601.1 Sir2 family NAD-dependent protein deacetylase [Saccharopolyspora sp. HNM0983]
MTEDHERDAAQRPDDEQQQLQRAAQLFAGAQRITALTGAGVSTASGIPDFRGPQGVWTKDPAAQRLTDIDSYLADAQVREQAWRSRADNPAWQAEPNAAHGAFTDLHRQGRLRAVLTQNIDELHQRGGLDADRVLELHGTMFSTVCLDCGAPGSMRQALDRVAEGEADPPCRACGGILKSATVSFGQSLDADVLRAAQRAALDCDLFVAAGTSLSVFPAAGFAELAARAGTGLVICNAEPTPFDDMADAVLRDPLVDVLPRLVAEPQTSEAASQVRTFGDPATWG